MSELKCDICGFIIEEEPIALANIKPYSTVCPKCGSHSFTKTITLTDRIDIHERIIGKSKVPDKKKPVHEFIAGDEWSASRQKYVHKERRIDRVEDTYYENVVDKEANETIHHCSEPLSQHYGHGSAKKKADGFSEKADRT